MRGVIPRDGLYTVAMPIWNAIVRPTEPLETLERAQSRRRPPVNILRVRLFHQASSRHLPREIGSRMPLRHLVVAASGRDLQLLDVAACGRSGMITECAATLWCV